MKSFKTFLLESEGIYDSMRDSIEQRIRAEHRKRHESGQIPEREMTREHIPQYKLHHSLLEQVPGRSKIDYHDFDYSNQEKWSLNPHQEDKFRIYRFFVPKEGKPKAAYHVAVKIAHTPSDSLIDSESFPDMRDISFSIDGSESENKMPEMDFKSHHAVYSGLMDVIAHHHHDTGTHPDNYNFVATARDKSKQRAKTRRYRQISNILRTSS